MDVKEIVEEYLKANGYDGLFVEDCCACELDDLFPCHEYCGECIAGYKLAEENEETGVVIGLKNETRDEVQGTGEKDGIE